MFINFHHYLNINQYTRIYSNYLQENMGPKKAAAKKKGGDANENGGEMVSFVCLISDRFCSVISAYYCRTPRPQRRCTC